MRAGAIWAVQMVMSGGNLTIKDSEAVRKDGGQGSVSLSWCWDSTHKDLRPAVHGLDRLRDYGMRISW